MSLIPLKRLCEGNKFAQLSNPIYQHDIRMGVMLTTTIPIYHAEVLV